MAVCRAEATEGGRELLRDTLERFAESGTFANLLWSFHRAADAAGTDLATMEDHLTTLCARLYLAGQMSTEVTA